MSQPTKICLVIGLLLSSCAAVAAKPLMVESKLNLRDGPGQQHRVLMVMPAGAAVTVGECRGEWCRVDYRGVRGYASRVHLGNGTAAYAAAPAPVATEYSADDGVRVFQWNDRQWRDRYWDEMRSHRR
jgi:uncharacterized protein YraI